MIFFQLKHIFHLLESLGSARIEGNRTSVAELLETKLMTNQNNKIEDDESIQEIKNMEKAMDFIDDHVQDYPINRMFVSELHKKVVDGLSPLREGVKNPGKYRTGNVMIKNAEHCPPENCLVETYMNELFDFINKDDTEKYDLLKTALVHHRFAWIHPYANGNGRTVRLLTYAMLVKQGFNINEGRIINPTAIFCCDRNAYYKYLTLADRGDRESTLQWCGYVLSGLKREIEKIDQLLDYEFLKNTILRPAISHAFERKFITNNEFKILKVAVAQQVFQAKDIRKIMPDKLPAEISRMIRRLKEKNMLISTKTEKRKYYPSFTNSYLLRSVISALGERGIYSF